MVAKVKYVRLGVLSTLMTALIAAGLLAGCAQSTATTSDTTAPGLVNSVTDQEGILYTLYVGLADKDTGTQVLDMQEAKDLATPLVSAAGDGGYTVIEAQGGYTDDDGNLVENDTLVYTGVHASEQEILTLVDDIKAALNIESIYVTSAHTGYAIFGGQLKAA
ncbi:hypothetical protein [Eggerthella sp. YY7918]|uniref:hypothetical protein n=1 Tax=Eggerthella sp. (strain YY7918) TaxID=502558 RepID=UPI0002171451|nr:hypothetical protein [Eggerthella sp. YY7918]BAK44861.1 hypothetical protein EGYY_17210 [Eggerthella sp. YY7918]